MSSMKLSVSAQALAALSAGTARDQVQVTGASTVLFSGDYPVSRPPYFPVKKAHISVLPNLKEYIGFFVSNDMAGPGGPLAAAGLVSDPELAVTPAAVTAKTPMGPLV